MPRIACGMADRNTIRKECDKNTSCMVRAFCYWEAYYLSNDRDDPNFLRKEFHKLINYHKCGDFWKEAQLAAISAACEACNYHEIVGEMPIYWFDWLMHKTGASNSGLGYMLCDARTVIRDSREEYGEDFFGKKKPATHSTVNGYYFYEIIFCKERTYSEFLTRYSCDYAREVIRSEGCSYEVSYRGIMDYALEVIRCEKCWNIGSHPYAEFDFTDRYEQAQSCATITFSQAMWLAAFGKSVKDFCGRSKFTFHEKLPEILADGNSTAVIGFKSKDKAKEVLDRLQECEYINGYMEYKGE